MAKKKVKKAAAAAPKKRTRSRSTTYFASARIESLIRKSGATRVSAGAVKAMNELVGTKGLEMAKYAVDIARHSGRKTVKENDIILASQK